MIFRRLLPHRTQVNVTGHMWATNALAFSTESSQAVSTYASSVKISRVKRHTSKNALPKITETQNVYNAVELVKARAWAKFDETVEISLNLGVDPRKPNQSIRGVASLPHGTGKKVRIAVFATGSDASDALAAGADVVGAEDLLARVQTGDVPFDRIIATPEMMPLISKVGKVYYILRSFKNTIA